MTKSFHNCPDCEDIFCACCGGKPDDSKITGNFDDHCSSCERRYHNR